MVKYLFISTLLFCCNFSFATNKDSLAIQNLEDKVEQLSNHLKEVRRDELNYQIEKNLLKETYKNNYDSISLVISIVLGFFGIFGYLGIRDISAIKKDYEKELSNLRQIQGQFDNKALEFDKEKKKFDDELKQIIKENQEQSRKIKFIELKEKSSALMKDNLPSALEFTNAALDISPDDLNMLNQKARILCRLNQAKDAVEIYEKALSKHPKDSQTILNLAECWYFTKDIEKAKKIIADNRSIFERDDDNVLNLFEIFETYYKGEKTELIKKVREKIDEKDLKSRKSRMDGWDLKEALYFATYQPDSELKEILKNFLWYHDGQITGEALYQKLGIALPI